MDTVTVTRRAKNGRFYYVEFSALPGRRFGPWEFRETVRDLTVSALLSSVVATDLVLTARAEGEATRPVG